MPFVPHTEADVSVMLEQIGVEDIEQLFDEIPAALRNGQLHDVPPGMSEMAMLKLMAERAQADEGYVCFAGAGSYDHHIPSAVWDLTARGEFMTAYTPYQAEASQGTLQLIYEYQSMMTALTGLDVSNASVYDGASGLAEAILMAVRANKKNKSNSVSIAQSVHPHYIQAASNIVTNQGLQIELLALGDEGLLEMPEMDTPPVAVVVQQPNFFGGIEAVDALTDWAHAQGSLVIAVVNPMTLAVLKAPGQWGETGADIVCGDGQPFGVPMSSGGPSFGFICAKQALVRQMPGRIIGRTQDVDGNTGFALTLQAREQHIRRGKATSNICTNQGLLVTAGTIYLSLMGPQGLSDVACQSRTAAQQLYTRLLEVPGVEKLWPGPTFHEFGLRLPVPAQKVIQHMTAQGILPGIDLGDFVSGVIADADHCLLVAVTEKRTQPELDKYVTQFSQAIGGVV